MRKTILIPAIAAVLLLTQAHTVSAQTSENVDVVFIVDTQAFGDINPDTGLENVFPIDPGIYLLESQGVVLNVHPFVAALIVFFFDGVLLDDVDLLGAPRPVHADQIVIQEVVEVDLDGNITSLFGPALVP